MPACTLNGFQGGCDVINFDNVHMEGNPGSNVSNFHGLLRLDVDVCRAGVDSGYAKRYAGSGFLCGDPIFGSHFVGLPFYVLDAHQGLWNRGGDFAAPIVDKAANPAHEAL